MATLVSDLHHLQPERLRSFILPREHGAWGILLIPLLTGASIGFATGHGVLPFLLFIAASLSLFCLRTPVEAWLGASALRPQTPPEQMVLFCSLAVYTAIAALSVGWLLWRERALGLVLVGGAAVVIFLAQAGLKKLGRQMRLAAQVLGALGLTSTAAGAYYVVTGALDQKALILWTANWLFAINQIHFVQMRIHGGRAAGLREKLSTGAWFLLGETLTVFLLIVAWRLRCLPALAGLAFVPVLLRGLRWFWQAKEPLAIHRLGFTELAHVLVFGVLFILGFSL
jgi:hypothetical protein